VNSPEKRLEPEFLTIMLPPDRETGPERVAVPVFERLRVEFTMFKEPAIRAAPLLSASNERVPFVSETGPDRVVSP
jgi:hypothetical protein